MWPLGAFRSLSTLDARRSLWPLSARWALWADGTDLARRSSGSRRALGAVSAISALRPRGACWAHRPLLTCGSTRANHLIRDEVIINVKRAARVVLRVAVDAHLDPIFIAVLVAVEVEVKDTGGARGACGARWTLDPLRARLTLWSWQPLWADRASGARWASGARRALSSRLTLRTEGAL